MKGKSMIREIDFNDQNYHDTKMEYDWKIWGEKHKKNMEKNKKERRIAAVAEEMRMNIFNN